MLPCSAWRRYRAPMSNRPGPLGQSIAAEIRAELGRQSRTRRWLAEQLGQNHVTVGRWVNGEGPMSFDALDAICEALGITVADLLSSADTTKSSRGDNHWLDRLVAA